MWRCWTVNKCDPYLFSILEKNAGNMWESHSSRSFSLWCQNMRSVVLRRLFTWEDSLLHVLDLLPGHEYMPHTCEKAANERSVLPLHLPSQVRQDTQGRALFPGHRKFRMKHSLQTVIWECLRVPCIIYWILEYSSKEKNPVNELDRGWPSAHFKPIELYVENSTVVMRVGKS